MNVFVKKLTQKYPMKLHVEKYVNIVEKLL